MIIRQDPGLRGAGRARWRSLYLAVRRRRAAVLRRQSRAGPGALGRDRVDAGGGGGLPAAADAHPAGRRPPVLPRPSYDAARTLEAFSREAARAGGHRDGVGRGAGHRAADAPAGADATTWLKPPEVQRCLRRPPCRGSRPPPWLTTLALLRRHRSRRRLGDRPRRRQPPRRPAVRRGHAGDGHAGSADRTSASREIRSGGSSGAVPGLRGRRDRGGHVRSAGGRPPSWRTWCGRRRLALRAGHGWPGSPPTTLLVPLLFPDGRPPGPRWRHAAARRSRHDRADRRRSRAATDSPPAAGSRRDRGARRSS